MLLFALSDQRCKQPVSNRSLGNGLFRWWTRGAVALYAAVHLVVKHFDMKLAEVRFGTAALFWKGNLGGLGFTFVLEHTYVSPICCANMP